MHGLAKKVGLLGLGAALGAAGVATYTARQLNAPRRPDAEFNFTPFELQVPSEDLAFQAADGVRLAGWWFDRPESGTVVVCAHGHRGNKAELLGIGSGLWRAGHNVLLFDFRGNGDSGDGPQSLAHHEQLDLRAAIDLAQARRPDARIAVVAYSMGAATAILEAVDDPRVEVLVLDSAFTSIAAVVAHRYHAFRLPANALLRVADRANQLCYHYGFDQVRPIDHIGQLAGRPMLFLHGAADLGTPPEHSRMLAEAAGDGLVELVMFAGAGHCGGYFLDRPAYVGLVADFLDRGFRAVEKSS